MAEYVTMAMSALNLVGGVRKGVMAQKGAEADAQLLEWKQAAQNLQASQTEREAAMIAREGDAVSTEADLLAQRSADMAKIGRENLRREISAMFAKSAASGVRVDTGSSLTAMDDAAEWGALKESLTEQGNDIQVWEKRRQAMGIKDKSTITLDHAKLLRAEAPLYGWQATIKRIGGDEALYGNVSSSLGGALKISEPLWNDGSATKIK